LEIAKLRWLLPLFALASIGAPATVPSASASASASAQAVAYSWNLPPGFPPPWVPADNPMSVVKVKLGARLFRERRLSVTGTYACVSCHQPRLAFTDGNARAIGATGGLTRRSAMSLANVAYNAAYTWGDATVRTLERQMLQPLFNEHPVEIGLKGREAQVVALLSTDAEYQEMFATAFPGDAAAVSIGNVIKAIAAFERTLISGRSPFDRYVFDDDQNALSASAKRGMNLFYSARTGCAQCHSGLNFSGPMRYRGHVRVTAPMANTGLDTMNPRGSHSESDFGLMEVTHNRADRGKMRVPTLRNVALTAPYMHDGSIATLAEVIEHYAAAGRQRNAAAAHNHPMDRRIRVLHLSADEKRDLVAFLESLTDPEFVAPGRFE
jgi:cytochrome c peroxidase